ncbi:hypothetical protein SAMN05444337_0788 [Flavobacterium haoranii]|uniref:Uncharacterized protein n=1 Tax=Flavobacterium haoranii TaxID=683124 RepID=A0A1M6DZ94_9FLAO|nr:hypothetical protein SAMN05444337_0788 [Flavobacterium haoranii]
MKIAIHKILVLFISVFTCNIALAAEVPPPPAPLTTTPGLPIDGGLVIMFFAALILGYLVSTKYIFNKKSSL